MPLVETLTFTVTVTKEAFQSKANRPLNDRCMDYILKRFEHVQGGSKWTSLNMSMCGHKGDPSPMNWQNGWQTDITENITFPQTMCAGSKRPFSRIECSDWPTPIKHGFNYNVQNCSDWLTHTDTDANVLQTHFVSVGVGIYVGVSQCEHSGTATAFKL